MPPPAAGETDIPQGEHVAASRAAGRSYFPALDVLRALAFLMVFAQHYLQMLWGWTGVDVFFVLSGLLITGILYDTRDHARRVPSAGFTMVVSWASLRWYEKPFIRLMERWTRDGLEQG